MRVLQSSILDTDSNVNMDSSNSNDDSWRWETTHYPEMPKPVNFAGPPKFPTRQVTLTSTEVNQIQSPECPDSKASKILYPSGQATQKHEPENEINLKSRLASAAIPKKPRRQVSLTCLKCSAESSIVPPNFPRRRGSLVRGGCTDDLLVKDHSLDVLDDKQPTFPHRRSTIAASDCKAILLARMLLSDDVSILSGSNETSDQDSNNEMSVTSKFSRRQARLIVRYKSNQSDQEASHSNVNTVEDKKPSFPHRRQSFASCASNDCSQTCLNAQVLVSDNDKHLLLSADTSSWDGRAASVPPAFPQRQVSNITYEDEYDIGSNHINPSHYTGFSEAEEINVAEERFLDSLVPFLRPKNSCHNTNKPDIKYFVNRPRYQSQQSPGSAEGRSSCSSVASAA